MNSTSLLQILQSRVGPSSTMGFSPETTMPYPQLHPSQPGLIQVGLPGLGNSSDAIRRTINSQLAAMSGGYKESAPQVSFPLLLVLRFFFFFFHSETSLAQPLFMATWLICFILCYFGWSGSVGFAVNNFRLTINKS